MNDLFMYRLGQKRGGGNSGGGGSGGGDEWIGDGNTHIWISLAEGRTSPMLGVGVNGTVTVDWGDGSEPDTLTGTSISTVKYTPVHEYAKPGDYVITLSGGSVGILGDFTYNRTCLLIHANGVSDSASTAYTYSVRRVELGNNVKSIGKYALRSCGTLTSVYIPDSVTSIGDKAFQDCYFLVSIHISDSVKIVGSNAFNNCYTLTSVHIPDNVTSIESSAFNNCYTLASVRIPNSVTSISDYTFAACRRFVSMYIPDSVTSIGGNAFRYCHSAAYYDFSRHTAIPTLAETNAFSNIPSDCEIRVPASLVDEWKAATNWSTYADKIVGV